MAVGRTNDSGVMLLGIGSTDENIWKGISNQKTEASNNVAIIILNFTQIQFQ